MQLPTLQTPLLQTGPYELGHDDLVQSTALASVVPQEVTCSR